MTMSLKRFPFYYRTQQQYEAVRRWAITLRDPNGNSNRFGMLSADRAELRSKIHDISKNFGNVPESVPGNKKYIGVLIVPARLFHRITITESLPEALKSFGVELINSEEPKENKIKEPITATFNVRSQKVLSKLASQLDRKIGTGNWRFRGTRNFRKKLSLIENGTSANRIPIIKSVRGVQVPSKQDAYVEKLRQTGIDVTVIVDASAGLTQKDIEKMIFKAVLSA